MAVPVERPVKFNVSPRRAPVLGILSEGALAKLKDKAAARREIRKRWEPLGGLCRAEAVVSACSVSTVWSNSTSISTLPEVAAVGRGGSLTCTPSSPRPAPQLAPASQSPRRILPRPYEPESPVHDDEQEVLRKHARSSSVGASPQRPLLGTLPRRESDAVVLPALPGTPLHISGSPVKIMSTAV
jgi:hypothetical protein